MIVAAEFHRIIELISAAPFVLHRRHLNSYRPPKIALVLAIVAFLLMLAGIGLNYFGGGTVRYWQIAFALSLLAFVVWFSGPRPGGGE